MTNLQMRRAVWTCFLLFVVIAALVAAAGCQLQRADASGSKKVLTTFTVLADMARNVAGDKLEVESIIKPGAEIHQYEPTPSDIKRTAGVGLILDNGFGLESWFQQFIDEGNGAKHVTVSDGIEPIDITHGDYEGKPNPHAWMSPTVAITYVNNIRDAFIDYDPRNAKTYRANAAAYISKLDGVTRYLRTELAKLPANHRALVTCEGAFSYLTRDADIEEEYLWPVNSDEQGTPQQQADVITFVEEQQVPAVFCESTVNTKIQHQVADETGARYGGTLYVDSLSDSDGPVPTYLDLLRHDARTIVRGLSS